MPYKHGRYPTKLYGTWRDFRNRCNNMGNKDYDRYGGRGISVCKEWEESYVQFRDWALANGWKPGLEIDRKDNNGDYTPENCRFVTSTVNNRNRRNNRLSVESARKVRAMLADGLRPIRVAEILGVNRALISQIRRNKIWKE